MFCYPFILLHYRSPRRREKKRSPTPKPTKVHVGRLTRNVNKEHIHEIFSVYGTIKNLEMPSDRVHPHVSRGYAYVDYDKPEEAEKAVKHMDGGKNDKKSQIITKVACFSRLLKCLRSLYGKQCGPRSDCSYRISLFWVHTVCFYT